MANTYDRETAFTDNVKMGGVCRIVHPMRDAWRILAWPNTHKVRYCCRVYSSKVVLGEQNNSPRQVQSVFSDVCAASS